MARKTFVLVYVNANFAFNMKSGQLVAVVEMATEETENFAGIPQPVLSIKLATSPAIERQLKNQKTITVELDGLPEPEVAYSTVVEPPSPAPAPAVTATQQGEDLSRTGPSDLDIDPKTNPGDPTFVSGQGGDFGGGGASGSFEPEQPPAPAPAPEPSPAPDSSDFSSGE